jgi:Na+-driven multidrug efflux pump
VVYSGWWFAGAALTWLAAFLSSLFRGCGDTRTPSWLGLVLAPIYTIVSLLMTLGIGAWPGVGIAGPAIASIVTTAGFVLVLVRAIRRGGLGFVPTFTGVRLQRRLFGEIMHIGVMGSVSTVSASVTALLVTALVGGFGPAALAGYGIGVRTEGILSPLTFGIGTGLTTLVGVAAGAGDWKRANRAGWIGGLSAFALTGAIGWAIALVPESFSRLFSADPEVIAISISYLTRVAPFECLFGLGLALHFASQGAGRMAAPLTASIVRMVVATAGGWFAIEHLGLGLVGVFWAMAASLVLYGVTIALPLLVRPWGPRE